MTCRLCNSIISARTEKRVSGNLKVRVVYTLTDRNELRIDYTVTTVRETIVNLTSHPYFNLRDMAPGNILQHELTLLATSTLPPAPRSSRQASCAAWRNAF